MQVPDSHAPEPPARMALAADALDVPENLVPGYHIHRLIGRGAMASVYLAEQCSLKRDVALKVVTEPGVAPNGSVGGLPISEGRLLASITHRHVVTLYDIGVVDHLQYLSMEYLPGGDLRRRLRAAVKVSDALAWTEQLASALAAVHQRGIVHRDVKPANVMFRDERTPVLTDFGVAKDLNQTSSATVSGTVVGTLSYLSPEQADGASLDGRSDVYSLGIVLYEMLTGHRPWLAEGRDSRGLAEVLRQKHEPLPRLPRKLAFLQGLVDRMTAVDRSRRLDAEGSVQAVQRVREAVQRTLNRRRDDGTKPGAPDMPAEPTMAASATARGEAVVERIRAADQLAETCTRDLTQTRAGTPITRRGAALLEAIETDYGHGQLRLPALPEVVPKLNRLLSNPGVKVTDVARLLQAEPVIASQLVRLANSAAYAGDQPVSGLSAALARVGFGATRDYVTALAARAAFRPATALLAERMRACWEASCRVAAFAGVLARQVTGFNPDQAQLAGLLQGVGRLTVLACAGRHPHLLDDVPTLRHVERRLQAPLGAAVLSYWDFPDEILAVALEGEQWNRLNEGAADLCDLVQVARALALAGGEEGAGLPDPLELPAFGRLAAAVRKGSRLNLAAVQEAEAELAELQRCLAGV
jgi:HD-like signal output (HDOD) protein